MLPPVRHESTERLSTTPGAELMPDQLAAESSSDTNSWTPEREYEELEIGSVIPGPFCVTFQGRIVNFFHQVTPSKMPQAARGCLKLIVKDDTGALTVRLWYSDLQHNLHLGDLVSVWTTHVSNSTSGKHAPSSAPLFVSIFPERDRSCHFMLHKQSDDGVLCKTPLGYRLGRLLPGLVTLKDFVNGRHDLARVSIIVCVKSIGSSSKLASKKGNMCELVNVHVFDNTCEASLTLWGLAVASAEAWKPSVTVLLITNPNLRQDRRVTISLTAASFVDVDPHTPDACWLRKLAQKLRQKDYTNPPFPEGVFDTDAALTGPVRPLFTLADVDEFARAAPNGTFTGYLSVILLDLHITTLHLRNMLFCEECCGIPIYANATSCKCKRCNEQVALRLNPRMVGSLIDETGTLAGGQLLWSAQAWERLLGRPAEELLACSAEVLTYLEKRLAFLRFTLLFGWATEEVTGGRLAVLSAMM